jgi:A/G-specific adenine glycosylase
LSQAGIAPGSFADRLLAWWRVHGRHDLPWQLDRSPYRVWVSEIMLQQTQVATVVPYFHRFMDRFPDLEHLAAASLDEVLAAWTGLGYYARARNLHAAARECMTRHDGALPADAEALHGLPGIGRSTAHAILAQAWNRPATILDGNVKRVLSRHAAVEGWPGRSAVEKRLWREAEQRTPDAEAANYTQAIMDLGATLCTTRSPACDACPVRSDCLARKTDRVAEFPGRKPKKHRPQRRAVFLVIRNQNNDVLLVPRPPSGIWGGLWCFPESTASDLSRRASGRETLESVVHEFSHFSLVMDFMHLDEDDCREVVDGPDGRWVRPDQADQFGLPRPVQRLLESL